MYNMAKWMRLLVHEYRQIAREPRFWFPFLIPPLALVATQIWMLVLAPSEHGGLDTRLLFTLGALMSVMGGTLSADSFAGERERNTLELLLSLPVSIQTVFWAKIGVILPIPLLFALVGQTLFWFLFKGSSLSLLVAAFAFSLAVSLLVTGASVFISLRAGTVRAAGQMNALLVLITLLGAQFIIPYFAESFSYALALLMASGAVFTALSFWGLRSFVNHRF